MIEVVTFGHVAVAVLVGVWSVVRGVAGRGPNDVTLVGAAAVEVLLVVQVVLAIVGPFVGNAPTGSVLELWMYLISALLIPAAAVVWALVDRSRWSTVVLGVGMLAVAVMVYRMQQIWLAPTI